MREDIQANLLPFQVEHTKRLIERLRHNRAVLDASDTGTGKTYVASAVAVSLGLKPVVIAPKLIKNGWKTAFEKFNIKRYFISNIEQYKIGNTEIVEKVSKENWNIVPEQTENVLLIVDEAHCLKNYKTQNCNFLKAIRRDEPDLKILYLSATIGENHMHLHL